MDMPPKHEERSETIYLHKTKTTLSEGEGLVVPKRMEEAMADLSLEEQLSLEKETREAKERQNKIDNKIIDAVDDEFKPTLPRERRMSFLKGLTTLSDREGDNEEQNETMKIQKEAKKPYQWTRQKGDDDDEQDEPFLFDSQNESREGQK